LIYFIFTDGYVKLPKKTGLGVDINKELVMEENKTPHHWKNPVWRHKDLTVDSNFIGNVINGATICFQ